MAEWVRDAYGFEVRPAYQHLYTEFQPHSEQDEQERTMLWERFLFPEASAPVNYEALTRAELEAALAGTTGGAVPDERRGEEAAALVRQGVPSRLRPYLWQIFLHVEEERQDGVYAGLVEECAAHEAAQREAEAGVAAPAVSGGPAAPPDAAKGRQRSTLQQQSPRERRAQQLRVTITQVDKDLPRTFANHPRMQPLLRAALRRVLLAYARRDPLVGYCQGMNFVAGLLLLVGLDEEACFWSLCALLRRVLPGYYSITMIASEVDQRVLERLMTERMPQVAGKLEKTCASIAMVASSWFLCLFVTQLPTDALLRVWDLLLFERNRAVLFRVALSLVEMCTPALLRAREEVSVVECLQALAPGTFDAHRLIATAYAAFHDITPQLLQEMSEQQRPAVVMHLANVSMHDDYWKEACTSYAAGCDAVLAGGSASNPGSPFACFEAQLSPAKSLAAAAPLRRRSGGPSPCASPRPPRPDAAAAAGGGTAERTSGGATGGARSREEDVDGAPPNGDRHGAGSAAGAGGFHPERATASGAGAEAGAGAGGSGASTGAESPAPVQKPKRHRRSGSCGAIGDMVQEAAGSGRDRATASLDLASTSGAAAEGRGTAAQQARRRALLQSEAAGLEVERNTLRTLHERTIEQLSWQNQQVASLKDIITDLAQKLQKERNLLSFNEQRGQALVAKASDLQTRLKEALHRVSDNQHAVADLEAMTQMNAIVRRAASYHNLASL